MILPFRDHNPSRRRPFINYALIATNVLVFLSYWSPLDERVMWEFYFDWAFVPRELWVGRDLHTLLTSMFLHGGVMHLLGNMLFLYIFGDNLEDLLGHFKFLIYYLVCGLVATTFHLLSDLGSDAHLLGASGAVAGVMGGYLLLFPKARVDVVYFLGIIFGVFPVRAWIVLGIWFGLQIYNVSSDSSGGVAYWAHIGGFLTGVVLIIPRWIKLGTFRFWSTSGGHPIHPGTRTRIRRTRFSSIANTGRKLRRRSANRRTGKTFKNPWGKSSRRPNLWKSKR